MNERYMPLAATIVVFLAIYVFGAISYNNFLSTLVFGDLLTDNAFVIIAAIGATFVILSGGIDLSVGSMIGFVSVAMAALDGHGWHPLLSALLMVGFGAIFGGAMGALIDACEIQPFILTLAAMFLLRGLCFVITLDSLPIGHPFVGVFSDWRIPLPGDGRLSASALLMLVALAAAIAQASAAPPCFVASAARTRCFSSRSRPKSGAFSAGSRGCSSR
jgi:simple sugar transport system permease protein